jgi:branched-chain amino acid transport system ATP-binding protein
MLSVNNIKVLYDKILVLRGLSLEVPERGIVALLGSNGAGKSTTLKAISGLLSLDEGRVAEGQIVFDGRPIHRLSAHQVVTRGITHVLEDRGTFRTLTVAENLRAAERPGDRSTRETYEMIWRYFPILRRLVARQAGYCSGGEQQMLVIARALLTRPRLMLLDEPSLGLAPLVAQELFRVIARINEELGTAILLVEQNANLAFTAARYGYILEHGELVLDGPVDELRENKNVREFYLGMGAERRRSFTDVKSYRRKKRWFSG